jgi:hypothetical protein
MTKEKRDYLVKRAEERLASGEMLVNKSKPKGNAPLLDKAKYAACQRITKMCALSGINIDKFAEIMQITRKQALEIHCSHYDRMSMDQLIEAYETIQTHLGKSPDLKQLLEISGRKIA